MVFFRNRLITLRAGLLVSLLGCALIAQAQSIAVLIIDDLGNSLPLGRRAALLPGKINVSILPHTPNARVLAETAHTHGKEILLHLPMSNINGAAAGPGKLSPAMNKAQFIDALNDNLSTIPYARGVNNHMGSLLTQLHQPMQWLMEALRQQRMYFIDSRTSPLTVAEQTAARTHVPVMRRDVFLDNDLDEAKIERQFEHWIKLTQKRGVAVAIAHPHPQTLDVLERLLPSLAQRGIHLAFASEVLNRRIADSSDNHEPPTTASN